MGVNGNVYVRGETAAETGRRHAPLRRASFDFCKRQRAKGFGRRDLIAVMSTQLGILIRNEFTTLEERQRILGAVGTSVTTAVFSQELKKQNEG